MAALENELRSKTRRGLNAGADPALQLQDYGCSASSRDRQYLPPWAKPTDPACHKELNDPLTAAVKARQADDFPRYPSNPARSTKAKLRGEAELTQAIREAHSRV